MREELAHAARSIPLRDREGSVRAFAMVDAGDYEGLSAHRWHLTAYGYAARHIGGRKNRKSVLMHREVLHLAPGDPRQCDHRNLRRLDNRRANLRIVTDAQNKQNVRARRTSTSRYRGVHWDAGRGKWTASATLDGRTKFLGRFDTEQEAADAAAVWREAHMPFTTN